MVVLGSTGSIGVNTLEIAKRYGIKIEALVAGNNYKLLNTQIKEFKPEFVVVKDKKTAEKIEFKDVKYGEEAVLEIIEKSKSDLIVNALVGDAGLRPTLKAQQCGKKIALANKESLVNAGKFIDTSKITPIDSEHFGLWYLLNEKCKVKSEECKVIDCCTGSGVIAIEIAKHTNAKVIATDISDTAIEVCRKNIMLNEMKDKIYVVKGDLLKILEENLQKEKIEIEKLGFEIENGFIKADILVSNPPYVENSWKKPNDYEPDLAFYGGDDGLDIVKKLINQAISLKYKAAVIEIGYNQKEKLNAFLKDKVKSFEFFEDLAGNVRGVEIIF